MTETQTQAEENVCRWGEDTRESEGEEMEKESREQVLLTWGGKGCRVGMPSSE